MAPRGVHDDEVPLLLLELVHALLRDGRGVRLGVAAKKGDARLGGVLLQLIKGTCRPPGAEYCKEVLHQELLLTLVCFLSEEGDACPGGVLLEVVEGTCPPAQAKSLKGQCEPKDSISVFLLLHLGFL